MPVINLRTCLFGWLIFASFASGAQPTPHLQAPSDQQITGFRPLSPDHDQTSQDFNDSSESSEVPNPLPNLQSSLRGGTEESVLAGGAIYKLAVPKEGMYKLTYDYLKNTLKMPVDQIDPRDLHLYGNGGAMLPRANASPRPDDLVENAVYIFGEEDGSFDNGDYLLFYAPGPQQEVYDDTNGQLTRVTHLYDTRSYYFLKVDAFDGLRVDTRPNLAPGSYSTASYDDVQRLEDEVYNLLDGASGTQGSGMRWFGDRLSSALTTITYTNRFDLTQLVPGEPVQIAAAFASRSDATNTFTLKLGAASFKSNNMGSTSLGNVEAVYARLGSIQDTYQPTGDNFSVQVTYSALGSGASGWVDYIELRLRRQLVLGNQPLRFADLRTIGQDKATFNLAQATTQTMIWDIRDPLKPVRQEADLANGQATFTYAPDDLHTFMAFRLDGPFLVPEAIGQVPNQNLHGILEADMLIVYHPDFKEAASELAQHRQEFSGLKVAMASVDEVFNEFSSGAKDPYAIRDLARMIWKRDSTFRSLLLFGDASFDYRNVRGLAEPGDFVPVFETDESLDPVRAYPTDDLFGILEDDEGASPTNHTIDIAVGRLPVETAQEASDVVNKIIGYDQDPAFFDDWRLRFVNMADDEDSNYHLNDADELAELVRQWQPELNQDKVYLDAFKQISTPGGERYPDANKALNNNMFKGALVVNYLGHGGTSGWTQERVLYVTDIQNWTNSNRLPLFLTATCTFAAFDNPGTKSAGELVLLNPKGGSIALFSTVRPVYAGLNKDLAENALRELFNDGEPYEKSMGESLRLAKNKRGNGQNDRKFMMLGDPAQHLAYPRLRVVTTKLNGIEVTPNPGSPIDTLMALQTVTVEGRIEDQNGDLMSDFNGTIYPTLFDKAITAKTLGNDPDSYVREFRLQKNILFEGAASVENGLFSVTMTLPKDIIFEFGTGKLSYYAFDGVDRDATGNFEDFIIFGVDDMVASDDTPPVVDVFMNDSDWSFGGLTGDRPILYVELYDDSGFNISGNSIGHDPIGVLNEDTKNTYALNDFFEPVKDDFRRGIIRYPLQKLEPGRYSIRVRAWDIHNNPGEGYTEFVVGTVEDGALAHVLNYPNPFGSWTNFQFEHNLAGQRLEVNIQIFDMTGRPVKTITEVLNGESNRVSSMGWDGKTDLGGELPNGLYLYKIRIRALDGLRAGQDAESSVEKLVLLK
ncbi:MAG: type IX secretion system sortase PorU [Lewinellaceae bacterium]|nr:type IX secretion system sortase PorU [Saprospiraceae bacterium]MCB9312118.1 type IX secretion system sortase PorU [Lewinellaceae bacterium]